ncbi:MBL fold metallo-hydrolase [Streptomyces sp. DSM 44915]|uniref:MBL fold metallo-hydrolase n=1 Tax=Streptomyces chisholmiae TaxID=3075540 RepID=A0ABU2JPB4_9ACTN|nr:MBL fold metallo-hydrolase [Streptomyces sp. DSM 44915]MDT0266571.1 MBL fold metallo-hydrolase [Streptomyces sp. DSM 44915]
MGRGLYAWLPERRGWGLANCGLLVGAGTALWIDTPYDPPLAAAFLDRSRALLPAGVGIDRVVVTHANGDHFWGAGVVPDAEVVCTREARRHLCFEPGPAELAALVAGSDPASPLGGYLRRHFGVFDWSSAGRVRPDTYFTGELELTVGGHPVRVSSLPPAHTAGDLLVHLPAQDVVFTGDVVFASTPERPGDHPVHWAGPLAGVIGACERALATGAGTFVPGHGPVLDRAGVRGHIGYLERVRDRAHALHAAGVPAGEAARRVIAERAHPELGLPERLLVTIGTEYRHLDGAEQPSLMSVMTELARLAEELATPPDGRRG